MSRFVGINAGGSKTDFVLTDFDLNIFYSSSANPCNMKKEGTGKAIELLESIINKILSEGKAKPDEITGICAGFAGGGRAAEADAVKNGVQLLLKDKFGIEPQVIVTTDALITLEGAFSGKEGVVLIAGTGSILYAKDNRDIFHRAGGFGRIIGDEGSGYSIGRKGLAAAAKCFDSRAKENVLTRLLKERYLVDSSEALIRKIYEEGFEASEFAPLVIGGAESGDEVCVKIADEESDELVLHLKAVKNYFGASFRLCLSGGIITTENYFAGLVKEKIKSRFPAVEIIEPEMSPELGAALLIMKKSGN